MTDIVRSTSHQPADTGLAVVGTATGDLGAARANVAEMVELVRRLEGTREEPGWTSLVLAASEGRSRSVARLAGAVRTGGVS
jgi:hypothetical protein